MSSQFQQTLRQTLDKIFPRTHGSLYDLVVFVGAVLLPWIMQPLGDAIQRMIAESKTVEGALMLAALLLQIPGSLLKRKALFARVAADPERRAQALMSEGVNAGLLFLYWLFMTFMAMSAIVALTDWSAGPGMGTVFTLATVVTGIVAYAAWLPGVKDLRAPTYESERDAAVRAAAEQWEYVADALLMIAALIVMYAIWQPMIDEIASGQGHIKREANSSIGGGIAYMIVLALPFAMFYIAPRLMFFVEDARARGTWIRFGIIYLFAAFRMFFG
ncbi:MAG: hypothetical protein NXI24_21220 [bacterium]|nr:hypothetical protein [bacterium]